MKKTAVILLLILALMLGGCSREEDPHPEWADLVRAENLLAVQTPEGFTLNENNDALSPNGIYYFTWTKGEGSKIVNAEGEDAQSTTARSTCLRRSAAVWSMPRRALASGRRWRQKITPWKVPERSRARTAASRVWCSDRRRKAAPLPGARRRSWQGRIWRSARRSSARRILTGMLRRFWRIF